jgi:hypothetical protein
MKDEGKADCRHFIFHPSDNPLANARGSVFDSVNLLSHNLKAARTQTRRVA